MTESDALTPDPIPEAAPDLTAGALRTIAADRVLAVVRAPRIPDPASLCAALVAGGIRTVEFTFTTPGVAKVLAEAAATRGPDLHIGAGTVLTAAQAAEAIRSEERRVGKEC